MAIYNDGIQSQRFIDTRSKSHIERVQHNDLPKKTNMRDLSSLEPDIS